MITRKQAKELIRIGNELNELLECLIVTLADETDMSAIQSYFDNDQGSDMWPEVKK